MYRIPPLRVASVFTILLCQQVFSQDVIIIDSGSVWKYWANSQANAPGNNWKDGAAFDDSGWPSGPAKLGFGGDGEITCVPAGCGTLCSPGSCSTKYWTTYFRYSFNISDPASYFSFIIRLLRDDGAVVYVNGEEVWRDNMPSGLVSYTTAASTTEGNANELTFFSSPTISNTAFVSGQNIIAVEIHQSAQTSSDLGFNLQLAGQLNNEVIYMWSGAVTPTSVKVNAKLTTNTSQARLLVSTSPALTNPLFGPYSTADTSNNRMAALSISGLSRNTRYYYAVESDGVLDNSADDIGTFVTSSTGPFSFKFTLGSCLNSNTNHQLFSRMLDQQPLFFLATGDLHYDNPNSGTDINVHRLPYENNLLSKSNYSNFFKNYPLAYVWDDHDYAGNDTDSTAAGKSNARRAFREYIPHYPFGTPIPGMDAPIYQAFTIGRVRFILTDLRSSRGNPTMMGAVQKQWFKDQCVYARDNDLIIGWVSSVSFGGNQADNWGGFTAERTELSNFFRDNNIKNMFIMSGDAHMVAIDNGTNHDFSTGNNNPNDYPVFQAAALNQSGGSKGGTYSEGGIFPNPDGTYGQYGLIEVFDPGGSQICITMTGYRVTSAGVESLLTTYNFCRNLTVALPINVTSFSVRASQNGIAARINWNSKESDDCDKYIIERSRDGVNFSSIVSVNCKGSDNQFYQYEDANVFNGWNYYRIKFIQKGGKTQYTSIQKIYLSVKMLLKINPNPTRNTLNISIDNLSGIEKGRYIIYNIKYEMQARGIASFQAGNNHIRIPIEHLSAGTYVLHLVVNGEKIIKKFIVL